MPAGAFNLTDIVVKSSRDQREPGVFGIWRPVLLLPEGITTCLTPAQLDAILLHERCHVRRRDNLAAALHVLVEALYWFHPVVWWLEGRLIDERERACDEEVVRAGSEPAVYAEGILRVCRFCVDSPFSCASGVTGSDLRKRVETIMSKRVAYRLNAAQRLMLASVSVAAIAGPIIVGVMHSPQLVAQSVVASAQKLQAFDVASVKRSRSAGAPTMMTLPGGRLTVTNMPVWQMIQSAYGLQDVQIVGGPAWIGTTRFDLEAKANGNPTTDQIQLMLRSLLADRFELTAHVETRETPFYALVMASADEKPGAHLKKTETDCLARRDQPPPPVAPAPPPPGRVLECGIGVMPGYINARGVTLGAFTAVLSGWVGRVVVDRTGFMGGVDLDLSWTPPPAPMPPGPPPEALPLPPIDPNGPSLFRALQEQLGLKLESTKGLVEVLVIDRASQPTAD